MNHCGDGVYGRGVELAIARFLNIFGSAKYFFHQIVSTLYENKNIFAWPPSTIKARRLHASTIGSNFEIDLTLIKYFTRSLAINL